MNSDDYTSNGESVSSPYSNDSTTKQTKSKNPKYAYDRHKDKKPRRNKSAFIIFSSDARAKIKAENSDNPNSNEIMVRLADMWKNLSKEESSYYKQKALEDKKRYHRELEEFWKANPLEVLENKTKRNHVKKPSSAYGLFLREMKDDIKNQQPGIKMAAVMKIIGEKWKNLDEKKRQVYQDRARKEQEISREKLGKHFAQNGGQPEDLFKKTKQRQQSFMRKKVKMEKTNPLGSTQTTTPMQTEYQTNIQDSFTSQYFPDLLPLQTFDEINTDVTIQDQYTQGLPSFPELDQMQVPTLQQSIEATEKANAIPQATEEPMIRVTSNLFPSDQSKETGDSNLLFKLLNQPLMFKGDSKLDLLNFDSTPGAFDNSSLKLFGNSSFKAFLSTKDYETEEAPKMSRADIFNNAIMRALDKESLETPDELQRDRNMSGSSLNYLM